MIKTLSIAISAMVVVLVSLFSDPQATVKVTSATDPQLVPGKDCIVTVTISKGDVSGYGLLQQLLPYGLTATPVELHNARFEMEDNLVKMTWESLPDEKSFTVSYKIQTDPNELAMQTVTGTFYYVENTVSKKFPLEPLALNFSAPQTASATPGVERKISALTPEGGSYKVELVIHKKEGETSARFVDNIPPGYALTTIDAAGGKFIFNEQQATFQWDELPAGEIINISYHMTATGTDFEKPTVTGMLVYGEANSAPTAVASSEVTPVNPPAPNPADQIAANLVAQETPAPAAEKMITYIPAPQKGIFFKIQIAATKKSPVRSDDYFQKIYHFGQHVDLTEHEGWRKYMIGNFDTYASASEFSKRTREKVKDAFVVAYRNADRIPVKEAVSEITRSN